jgi:basic membrane protein A
MYIKTRVFIAFLVLCFVVFSVFGCSPENEPDSSDGPAEDFKIAFLLPGSIDDGSWNSSAYEAVMSLEKEGYSVNYVDQVATTDIEELFRNYASRGYKLIIGHGYQFGEPALRVAPDFPESYFFSSGVCPVDKSILDEVKNVGFIDTKEYESCYISGYLAAAVSKTGTIGFIAGMGIPVQIANTAAFILGAHDMNENIEVLSVISGDFNDAALGREIALAMIDGNADVICNTADSTGFAAIEAAAEKGVKVIGYGADQSARFPGTWLTAGLSDAKEYLLQQVERIKQGTFGGEWRPGYSEGIVLNTPLNEELIPADVIEKVELKMKEIREGTFVVQQINEVDKIPYFKVETR